MADYDNDVNKYPGEAAIKILFYGVLLGVSGYAAGAAMANKIETIYQMLGLNGSTTKNYDQLYIVIENQNIIFFTFQ